GEGWGKGRRGSTVGAPAEMRVAEHAKAVPFGSRQASSCPTRTVCRTPCQGSGARPLLQLNAGSVRGHGFTGKLPPGAGGVGGARRHGLPPVHRSPPVAAAPDGGGVRCLVA